MAAHVLKFSSIVISYAGGSLLLTAIYTALIVWIIGLAVPFSFLAGIMGLQLSGLTVNIVVLFSLILAVGELVDDAIIVTEYAERRMAEGMADQIYGPRKDDDAR